MVIDERGFAVFAVFFAHSFQLGDDDVPDFPVAFQDLLQLRDFLFQITCFFQLFQNIFLVDITQLDLRHKIGLNLVDAEADHQIRHNLGVKLGLADDGNRLVNVQQNPSQTLEQVQAVALFLQVKVDAPPHTLGAPRRPLV